MKNGLLYIIIGVVLTLLSCHDDGPSTPKVDYSMYANRTVIVYMAADNDLSSNATADIREMLKASTSMSEKQHIVLFVDKGEDNAPYICEIKDSTVVKDERKVWTEDVYSCDPQVMYDALSHIMENYAADSYGLVLWGHASGWFISTDSIESPFKAPQKAYGVDNGNGIKGGYNHWMNIPTLADVIGMLPRQFDFILADCCNFMSVESIYELRHCAKFIVGSPAEIPVDGAPYQTVMKDLMLVSPSYLQSAADDYINITATSSETLPLTIVDTEKMEILADAMAELVDSLNHADVTTDSVPYYRTWASFDSSQIFHDIKGLAKANLTTEMPMQRLNAALAEAIVYQRGSSRWLTSYHINFNDFKVNKDNACGMSMYHPKAVSPRISPELSRNIRNYEWYYRVFQ